MLDYRALTLTTARQGKDYCVHCLVFLILDFAVAVTALLFFCCHCQTDLLLENGKNDS